MTGFSFLTSKKLKKLHQIFAWFTIFSLIFQLSSGLFLARPAFAEEASLETPIEETVEESTEEPTAIEETLVEPTEETPAEPVNETPAEEPVEESIEETIEELTGEIVEEEVIEEEPTGEPILTVEQDEEVIEEPIVDEGVSEEIVEEEIVEEPEADLEEPEVAEESAELNPSVFTDKEDYAPGETVKITGENFPANATLTIKITRPDGSVVKGDGSFEKGSDEVITNEEGRLEYYYQLNGIEGEYLVEVVLDETVLTTVAFTDHLPPPAICTIDTAGANDEPGQKDLNEMCANYENFPDSISITWNWDKIGWSGQNTGDACSLYDTDGDGNANYAACVSVKGDPATYNFMALYQCGDDKPDRCTQSYVELIPGSGTYCGASVESNDPFDNTAPNGPGDDYPNDTVASCTIDMDDVGGAGMAELIDVCSIPSREPNSDPSDCIVAQKSSAKLEIKKVLDPSNDSGLFDLLIDGIVKADDAGNGGTTGEVVLEVNKNGTNFEVSEQAGTSTNLSNYSSSIECRDFNGTGSVVAQTSGPGPLPVTLRPDDDVACIVTNSISKGTIIVEKQTNPDGDQAIFPFTGDAAGSITDGQQIVVGDLVPGTYTSTENVPGGWVLNNISCDDGNSFGDLGTKTATFNLDPGETVKCTFTNTKYGSVKVIKNVEPDDGSLWNFTLTVGGYTEDSGLLGNGGEYTFSDLPSDTYNLSENEAPKPGYDTSVSCDSGGTGTHQVLVNLASGEDAVCTFINKPKPKLTLEKAVTNNDGGNALATDWTLYADGIEGSFSGTTSVTGTVEIGVAYTLSESGPSGYLASSWNCNGGTQNGDEITLGYGDDVICAITNDDIAPTLTLIKYIINDDGGTASDIDWILYATGSERLFSGTTPASDTVKAGIIYTLTETGPSGYSASNWVCDGGVQSGNQITLGLNENVTCAVTNDDQPAYLTVIKNVINDDGGPALASSFTMTIGGVTVIGGSSFPGDESGTTRQVYPGAYNVTEMGPSGYLDSYNNCAASIALGESKTCTITNDDIAPRLTLVKVIVNDDGGTATKADFQAYIDGSPVPWGVLQILMAGSHVASEIANVSGYTASDWTGACAANGEVILNPGDNLTCTITNDDIAPKLIVTKVVINDDGGTALVSDFPLFVDGNSVNSGDQNIFNAGAHVVSEIEDPGYTATISGDCDVSGNITLDPGDVKFCTITNDDIAPTLTLIKTMVTDDGGIATEADFQAYINGSPVPWSVTQTLSVGLYTASEDVLPGYTPSDWGGNCATDGTITLLPGDKKVCTITNDDQPGEITVCKYDDLDGDGKLDIGEPGIMGVMINLSFGFLRPVIVASFNANGLGLLTSQETGEDGCTVFSGLSYGNYRITEIIPVGYYQTFPEDPDYYEVLIGSGVKVMRYFLNARYGSIGDFVWEDVNGDAVQDAGEPGIGGVTANLYLDDGDGIFEPGGDDGSPVDTQITDGSGGYLFENLVAGDYWVDIDDTTVPVGYVITTANDPLFISLIPGGSEAGADFGYIIAVIELSLDKTSDKVGVTASPGDTITFTLTVSNAGPGMTFNTVVKDVLPDGFSYLSGTAEVDGVASEPTISGQSLSWSVGNIATGDSVTIVYEVKTESGLPAGEYPNVAVASGNNKPSDLTEITTSYTNFVHVYTILGAGVSASTAIGGTVLGISTGKVLGAATGAETRWLILAILMILAGLAICLLDKKKTLLLKKLSEFGKKLAVFMTIALAFLTLVGSVWAINSLYIRIAELPEYKRTDNFKLYYTALERDDKSITVNCYFAKDSGFSWRSFGGTQAEPSGYCQAIHADFDGDGTYRFYTVAASADGSSDSNETVTILDRSAPETPRDYRKSRETSMTYKIHWRNPDDSDYNFTRVFTSTEQNFTADDSTKKEDIYGNPNQEFDHVFGGFDPNKDHYFALQGFDKAGNFSGLAGDGGTVTYEETIVEEESSPVTIIPLEVAPLSEEEGGEEDGEEGQILGGETVGETVGEIPETTEGISDLGIWKTFGLVAIGAGIIALIGYFFKRR